MLFKKLTVVFLAVAGAVFAKDNLAVLPFTGGTPEEGETIAELFSFSDELNEAFTPIPRTSITQAIGSEWKFQTDTGMTDPDTIMFTGRQLGANYVLAGNITKLGNQNLLTIAILKIDGRWRATFRRTRGSGIYGASCLTWRGTWSRRLG
ncbi:MAG: penicillin-binding protein activator LpoB [Treponema sp.]|jgi:TolB-like protein|nr:penicillin-binding protein activator LpoB [Treponema sp.]